ncbi:hypothetical protein F5Y11DRAFT_351519 [Daldinia sp. FL1419]|nr:hypothetical protein F5Y11DRAFT_351519 [Daldinia sp. FL1419]
MPHACSPADQGNTTYDNLSTTNNSTKADCGSSLPEQPDTLGPIGTSAGTRKEFLKSESDFLGFGAQFDGE